MTELVVSSSLEAQMTYAKALAASDLLPPAYRGKPANVLVALALGDALGLPTTAALYGINVISGKPTLSAETMRAVVLSHGHRFDVEAFTETEAIVAVARRERPEDVSRFSFSMDDAKRAGLVGGNYEKYPKAMLLARATSTACRAIFPDVLAGVSYTPEELEEPIPYEPTGKVERLSPEHPIVDAWSTAQSEARQEEPVEAEIVEEAAPANVKALRGPAAKSYATTPASGRQIYAVTAFAHSIGYRTIEDFLASSDVRAILGGAPSEPLSKAHASQILDAAKEFEASRPLDVEPAVEEDVLGEEYEARR